MLVEEDCGERLYYILNKEEEHIATGVPEGFIRTHINDYFVNTKWDSLLWGNMTPDELEAKEGDNVESFSILIKQYKNWGIRYDAVKDNNEDIELYDSYGEAAEAIKELESGPVYLGHNEYSGPDYFIVDNADLPDCI